MVCARHNPQGNLRPLSKCRGKKYCLVIVDAFSKWTEIFPTQQPDALSVAKALCKDIIPRYGIPERIFSDNGAHFVNQVVEKIGRAFHINLKRHCAYHPQSAGLVERTNQVAAGFESALCWWCTLNKNVDRINYIHYNVQKLANWTEESFEAVHEQLKATSLMAFQNRVALDMLLAEKGGVCAMFGDQCCTFIPNNTAADGRLTKALDGLRALNKRLKEQSGVDTSVWDDWMSVFGRWKGLVSSVLLSIAVFAAILTLCGCCLIPCLRTLINRLITTALSAEKPTDHSMYPLLDHSEPGDAEDSENDETELNLPDLFPDPGDYE